MSNEELSLIIQWENVWLGESMDTVKVIINSPTLIIHVNKNIAAL